MVAQLAVLTAAVLLVYAGVAPVAAGLSGPHGLGAAAAAAGLCLVGAGLALVACRLFRDPKYALYAVLVGMLLRMGIPLSFALAVCLHGGPAAEAGLWVYLIVFYPVALWVETALSLASRDGQRPGGGLSGNLVV